MNLCKDCKHFKLTEGRYDSAYGFVFKGPNKTECIRSSKIELVFGEPLEPLLNCEVEREDALRLEEFRCGP